MQDGSKYLTHLWFTTILVPPSVNTARNCSKAYSGRDFSVKVSVKGQCWEGHILTGNILWLAGTRSKGRANINSTQQV